MKNTTRIVFNVCRILLGLVFVFSGFVKGVDPLGSAYKFNDYFTAAGLPQMDVIALVMSFLLSAAEFLIGVALITGIFMNLTAWTALFFMSFFTVLTFILAIFNPVTDCGCFGDAIKLTNWETFYKNLILSILVVFIFSQRKNFTYKAPVLTEWIAMIITIAVFFSISIYSYRHLPVVDFMPYNAGSNITEKMTIPPGAPLDEYETMLVYKNKKTGEEKEFTMQNYPWQDTLNWKWANTITKLIKKGYTPPIHDFSINDSQANNITENILRDTGYVVLFIAYNINKSNQEALKFAEKLYQYSIATNQFRFYPISASLKGQIDKIREQQNLSFDFCSADETAMKTVIRSNPGLVLLKKGTVIAKYHYNDFQKFDFQNKNYLAHEISKNRNEKEWALSFTILLGLGMVLAFAWGVSLYFRNQCKSC